MLDMVPPSFFPILHAQAEAVGVVFRRPHEESAAGIALGQEQFIGFLS